MKASATIKPARNKETLSHSVPASFAHEFTSEIKSWIPGSARNSATVFGEEVFSVALFLPGMAQDASRVLGIVTGGKFTAKDVASTAAAYIEKIGNLTAEDLVAQSLTSIAQTATEVRDGSYFSRDPVTPAVQLYAAEKVMAGRGIEEKAYYLDRLMEECAKLSKLFEGKDAKGVIMARMMWEATNGIVAESMRSDSEKGMKTEHTTDRALQALNRAVQSNPDEMVMGLGIYVSTSVVPVFGVEKSNVQMQAANELLFANRSISTREVFINGAEPSAIVRSIIAGFEFVEGDEATFISKREHLEEMKEELDQLRESNPLRLPDPDRLKKIAAFEREVRMAAEMERLSMDAIIQAMHPGLFLEELELADSGRGHNRAIIKPQKYDHNRAGTLSDVDTAVTAFAATNQFYAVEQKMKGKMVRITPGTKKGKHGGVEPDAFLKVMYQATAPNENVRAVIGGMTKLIDKMGPFREDIGLGTIPLSATLEELQIIHDRVSQRAASAKPKITIIGREELKPMAEAMAKTTNLILGEILAEVKAKAGKRTEGDRPVFADEDPAYTAKLVYRLGRLLENNFVGKNFEAVGDVATEFNNFLVDVYTGQLDVTPEVEAATRMVFETSFAQYPRAIQVDFLKKLITRGITDPEKMNKWFEILYPVAVREQNYIPAGDDELYGVRPRQAGDVLRITRGMVDIFPDLGDEPKAMMEHVLEGDETFIASALRLTWAVGNKLHAREIMTLSDVDAVKKPGTAKEQRKLLKDLNGNLDILRQMLIGRLEREFAYEMRAKSPLAQFGNIERVLGLAEGFASQIVEVQSKFMHAFAATCGLFQEDVLIVDNVKDPTKLHLQTVPKSAASATAILDFATGSQARTKMIQMRGLLQNEEGTGEVDLLLSRAQEELDGRDGLAEDILTRSFVEGGARDTILAEAAGEMLGQILGIPADTVPEGGERAEKKPRSTSPRLRSLYTLWNGGYGSYGKSIALMAILTANQQAVGAGANSVASIIETLTRAESQNLHASVDLFEKTGEIGLHKSITDIGKELSLFTIGQVKSAEAAEAMRGQVQQAVLGEAKDRLARLSEIETQLTELHAQNDMLEVDTIRQQIELRKQAINANAAYARRELASALNAIYGERAQLVQTMGAIRASAVKSRMQVIQFLGDVFDPDGDYQQKRIALMRYIRKYTAADYAIAMPPEQVIYDLVGLDEKEIAALEAPREKKVDQTT